MSVKVITPAYVLNQEIFIDPIKTGRITGIAVRGTMSHQFITYELTYMTEDGFTSYWLTQSVLDDINYKVYDNEN